MRPTMMIIAVVLLSLGWRTDLFAQEPARIIRARAFV